MQKTVESATPGSSTETPKSRNPKSGTPKKKSASQKSLGGQKWFKGTPKSRSSKKLLKSPPVEKTQQKPPTPAGYVEFELDGSCERFSIYEAIVCGNSDDFRDDSFGKFSTFGTPDHGSAPADVLGSTKKTKSHKKDLEGSKKGKTPQNNRCKNKTKESETKKKLAAFRLPEASYEKIKNYTTVEAPPLPVGYIRYMEIPQEELADEVEYDLDGEDNAWLQLVNAKRKELSLPSVKFSDMELLMDRLEKESYFQSQSTGIDHGAMIDDDAVCCICMDGECQNSNAILFCDMCDLAVHQECYGVPYIPEGQWLCRRCLQSPSRAVDCALCPNKGGAFKQTDDGRWAHVVCAIWIPEVCFANTVFLEPVDSINNIPQARWRLVCFICKQKGIGACIQCHKSNCYVAFHVTCAQQAGLCMKMDTVRDSTSVQVKKTAYCDNHAPPESDFAKDGEDGTPSPRQKMRQTRKLLAENRSAVPVLSIPTIPEDRVVEISQLVSFPRKNQFLKRLMAYWKLKRKSRNGVPLLRRLQASSTVPRPSKRDGSGSSESKTEESQVYYRYWLRLRQDLERARLLCELVRKREKVKKDLIHLKCREVDIRLRPFCILLLNVLDEIASKDLQGIFAEPVDITEVPDYLDIVKKPMDLSTMREKINSFEYNSLDEFEADFQLMIDNCMDYNSKDTLFYQSAARLLKVGGIIIRHARRSIDAIGFDSKTGLHLPERNYYPSVLTDEEIINKVDSLLSDSSRFEKPYDEHLVLLHEVLDETLNLNHPITKKNKYKKIENEINRIRRMQHFKRNKLSSGSPMKQKDKRKEKVVPDSEMDETSDGGVGIRKRLRGSDHPVLVVKASPKESMQPKSGKRSLRPAQRKRDSSGDSSSEPPSPPVLRNSTISVSKIVEDNLKQGPPAKRSRRSSYLDKEESPFKGAKSKSNMVVQAERKIANAAANVVVAIGRNNNEIPTKTRSSPVLKTSMNNSSKSPLRNNISPTSLRKDNCISSPRLIATNPVSHPSSPACKKRMLATPSKSPLKAALRTSPSEESTREREDKVDVDSPRRRNSARTKKLAVNSVTINNNLISCANASRNILSENKTEISTANSSTPRSASTLPGANHKSRNSLSNSGNCENQMALIQSPLKKAKRNLASYSTVSNSDDTLSIPNESDRTSQQHISEGSSAVSAKPESFLVYRSSARDMDLNSDDEDDEGRDEEDEEEEDGDANSDSGGSSDNDDDDSVDGNQEGESEYSDETSNEGDSELKGKNAKTNSGSADCELSGIEPELPKEVVEIIPGPRRTRYETNLQSRKKDRTKKGDVKIGKQVDVLENVPEGNNFKGRLDDFEDADSPVCMDVKLQPLDLVWAKCKDDGWYPALIINPDTPAGFTQNDISIPLPPADVLARRPRISQENNFLVLCFDNKRTWEWITRNQLEPLGHDPATDNYHLHPPESNKKIQDPLRRAYEKALLHRNRVNGANFPS